MRLLLAYLALFAAVAILAALWTAIDARADTHSTSRAAIAARQEV